MTVDVCLSPSLYSVYHNSEAVVVVVDVFRATTTIAQAFKHGVKSIRTVCSIEEAMAYKEQGWLVGAEREAERCPFADFGNSPFDYTRKKIARKNIVFTTTNGTRAITLAQAANQVITGAFVNLKAVVKYCKRSKRDVLVLCSGWQNQVNIEDSLFAGALVDRLERKGFSIESDAAIMVRELWLIHKKDMLHFLSQSDHYHRLEEKGLIQDISFCLQLDEIDIVPELQMNESTLILKKAKKIDAS